MEIPSLPPAMVPLRFSLAQIILLRLERRFSCFRSSVFLFCVFCSLRMLSLFTRSWSFFALSEFHSLMTPRRSRERTPESRRELSIDISKILSPYESSGVLTYALTSNQSIHSLTNLAPVIFSSLSSSSSPSSSSFA